MSEAILPGVLGFLSRQFLYSSALFLVILPVTLFIRNRWPLLRQGLWALFFIRLVLPVDLSAPFSLRQLIAPESISTLAQVKLETSEHNASTPVRPAIPEGPAPGFGLQSQGTHEEVAPGQRMSIVDWANFSSKTSWQILVIALWILGAVFCAYIVFRKYTGYRRAARKASEIAVPGILNIVQNWRSKLAVHRQVKILVTELPVSPFTMGILQPRVVLPRFVVELGDEALLESIVAHELSHIKRFDALWLFVQNLLNVVYFFHPGVWYAASQLNLTREQLCDQKILGPDGLEPNHYAQSLLRFLKLKFAPHTGIQTNLTYSNGFQRLQERLCGIRNNARVGRMSRVVIYFVVFVVGLTGLPMAVVPHSNASRPEVRILDFGMPVATGEIKDRFGLRRHPTIPDRARMHKGVDIADKTGTPVYAVASGVVELAGTERGYGKHLFIDHGSGFRTLYGHLDTVLVTEGQKVSKFSIIGRVGDTGETREPCLHYEVLKDVGVVDWSQRDPQTDFLYASSLTNTSLAFATERDSSKKATMLLPLQEGRITSAYGMRVHPITRQVKMHRGIDIAASIGTEVFAAADGKILEVNHDPDIQKGYGLNIIIQHKNGFKTRYSQLSKILVEANQEIRAGEVIGEVGHSGINTGPHLHFEIYDDGERVNPENYIDFSSLKRQKEN